MRTEWKFGPHEARFEAPDVLVIRFSGPTSHEQAQYTVEICREVGTVQPFFMLVDIGDSTIEAHSRNYIVQNIRQEWFRGLIYFGLGFVQRAMAKALVVALYFTKWAVPVDFVATEEDARAVVQRRREKSDSKAA